MMITNFNKRKCLFKEIVKIPELCCATQGATVKRVQFRYVIKFFRMHEFEVFVSFRQRVLLALC
jgi:hypothetical protein